MGSLPLLTETEKLGAVFTGIQLAAFTYILVPLTVQDYGIQDSYIVRSYTTVAVVRSQPLVWRSHTPP